MKKLSLFVVCGCIASALAQPPAQERHAPPKIELMKPSLPDESARAALLAMLEAVEGDNFAEFSRHASDEFKGNLTQEQFSRYVNVVAARMEKGYDVVYFGDMKRPPYAIHLWKLVFKDGGRDILGEFSVKVEHNGKLDNFHIH
jgi:hypothetical protein